MEWLNIHVAKQLRGPACVGSSPAELGTWLLCLAYCCEQENGGRIAGGAGWKDRQLQRAIGVSLSEVKKADRLLQVDGLDIVVNGYPEKKQAEVQRLRKQSHAANLARWGKRDMGVPEGIPSGMPPGVPHGTPEGEGEGEGEEKGEGEGSAAAPPPTQAAVADPLGMGSVQPAPPPAPIPAGDWIDWKRSRRIYISRSDELGNLDDWRDLFRTAGPKIMAEAYAALIPSIPPPKGVGYVAMQRWIFDHYQEQKP